MTLACFFYAVAWESFLIPNNITSGGFTGLCTIVEFATEGAIPMAYSYAAVNVVLLAGAFVILGKSFGVRTIFCIVMSTVFLRILPELEFLHSVDGQFLYLEQPILIPIIGGLIEGASIAMIFLKGGSTGGTDIVSLVVNKYWPISPGKMYIIMDAVIISSLLLLPGKTFADVIYGYLCMIASSLFLDYVLLGNKSNVKILIFSSNFEKIADYIIGQMDRGVTVLKAQGWYTKEEKDVLLVIVRRRELGALTKAVKMLDRNAFMSVSPTSSVYGEGFEEMKTGIDSKKNATT